MRRSLLALTAAAALALPTSATASPPRTPPRTPPVSAADDPSASQVKEDSYYPKIGDPSVDVLHYDLDLDWLQAQRRLVGTATLDVRAPKAESSIRLDLSKQLVPSSVTLDGTDVAFTHPGKDLVVQTGPLAKGSRHTLVVTYAGKPAPYDFPGTRGDIPGLGWTTTGNGQVWSMQEPYGAFTWYPSHDQPSDKATYDVAITSKADWTGVSNGRLLGSKVTDGRRTTRWRLTSPVATYLVTVAIGPYERYTDRGPHGLPITYWVRPADKELLPQLRRTPSMLRWLEGKLGPYPFDRAGTVVVPADSAMETQTLVTMGNALADYGDVFTDDLMHEYAHQWYGDTVTPDDWKHLWLNESFAMYLQIRWEIAHGVRSRADWMSAIDDDDGYYRATDGPPGSYFPDRFGSTCVYYCGARMLYRLQDRLGRARFDRLLRTWPQRHRYGSADRGDWIRFAEKQTGTPLRDFVNHWLDARTSPR